MRADTISCGAGRRPISSPVHTQNPGFHIFATDLNTGLPWEFGGEVTGLHGVLQSGEITLSQAVAASAAFPPLLSPARFHFYGVEKLRNLDSASRHELRSRYELLLLGDGGLSNNLATLRCGESWSPCFVVDAAVTPQSARVYPTWFGQLLRSTLILYDRKEDVIRERGAGFRPLMVDVDPFWIRLQSSEDFLQGTTIEMEVIGPLTMRLPKLLKIEQVSDYPFFREWADQVSKMWNVSYFEGDVRTFVDNYPQYACNSMIPTRLKSLDDATIHNLVNLGYLAAELSINAAVARMALVISNQVMTGDEEEIPEGVKHRASFDNLLWESTPGLLRTKLRLPMPLEPVPSHKCRTAFE